MLQDSLDNKVAKFIVDQHLTALKRHPNEVFLPLTLGSRDALFHHLAPMLVPRHLAEVLDHGLVDHSTPFISFEQDEALAQHVIPSDVTAQLENLSVFQRIVDQCWNPV